MDGGGSVGKLCHHIFLELRGLDNHRFKLGIRHRQVQLIGGFDVRNLLEHIHQLRQIEELGEAGSGTIAGALRSQLDGGGGFTEGRCPGVEVSQIFLLEGVVLEVTHDRVKLSHGITDGGAGCKDDATTAGQLIHVAALHKHIRGFLGFGCGKTCHIPHLSVEKQIFEPVALVNEQPVNTQLFEGDNIILAFGGSQFVQPCLQGLTGFLHLLDGEVLATLPFQRSDLVLDLIDLLFQLSLLTLRGEGDLLELAVTDDDRIIVAGCDSGTELLAVGGFKVLLCGDQQIGTGIQPQELICPLQSQVVGNDEQGFLTQAQTLAFHSGCRHLEGLASTDLVCQQGVAAVKHMGNSVSLMLTKGDVGVHAAEADVTAVILTRTSGIEKLVVLCHQSFSTAGIFPDPILERILDGLLLLLSQGGFLLVQDTLLLAIGFLDGVVDANVLQVQGFL